MITVLEQILSRLRNPTANWPQAGRQDLTYDLRQRAINGYCLKSKLELATQFGKCAYVKRSGKEFLDLFYPASGLILEFASEELMGIVVIVSPDSFHVREDKMGVGKLAITDLAGRNQALIDRTRLEDVVSYLGEPFESGKVGDDMVHTFIRRKNLIDTYHNSRTGQLLQIEICETNESDSTPTSGS
jgi:hypothetical protein